MRSKFFIAFLIVIALALVSNFIFGRLIIKDFEDYEKGSREEHLYWLLAAVESSRTEAGWDINALEDALRWALRFRFECVVEDASGNPVLATSQMLERLSPAMKRRLQITEIRADGQAPGPFEPYPLFSRKVEIGTLLVRDIRSAESPARIKELAFKNRGRAFLIMSFAIAGGGAILVAVLLSLFLSKPLRELTAASEEVARGELSVRLSGGGTDELGRLKAAFNHMAESLEREDALRRKLTMNIAHELRTPLAVMKARLEAMTDGVIEANHSELEALAVELDSLTRLIGGIEDLTKAEAAFFKKTPPEKIILGEFLYGLVEGMRPLFADKGLSLSLNSRHEGLIVYSEPEKLEKAVKNILSNALRYTERGGVRVGCKKDGDMFHIEIKDSGKGIGAEEIPHIFERFHRGRDSTGFGLGLAIAKELVEIMGGRIGVESAPGEGSLFRVTLPRGKAP